jgi:hypothetical protein
LPVFGRAAIKGISPVAVLPSGNWEIRSDCEGVVYIDGLHGDEMLLLNAMKAAEVP